jgi:Bacterial regulatory proteins, tetR family
MDTAAPRSRRSPAAIRSLVLQAARELFAERGFGDVTMREVAVRAGVTQAQVFRHFGSKARLFVEAAYQPFYDFVVGYVRRWAGQGHGTDTSAHDTEVFVDGLYQLMLDNRGLLAVVSGFARGAAAGAGRGDGSVPERGLRAPRKRGRERGAGPR